MLRKRIPEAKLGEVADPRSLRGRRWPLETLLRVVIVSLIAGATSLAAAEHLTAEMSLAMMRLLRIGRRVPDTTLRGLLCQLDPNELRRALCAMIRSAFRRKALAPLGFPFGILAMDGKDTALPSCDDNYAQRQTQGEKGRLVGMLRTITCTLVSSAAKVCIDAIPIPASTNEMGVFASAFQQVVDAYGSLSMFRLISYDAGACSLANATLVRTKMLHYLFGLKGTQPTLFTEAKRVLEHLPAEKANAWSEDVVGAHTVIRRVFVTEEMAGFDVWSHLVTTIRIESERLTRKGTRVAYENRYYITSLRRDELSDAQWLRLIRLHWGVENNCHNTFDTALKEDDHPWITASPQGALAVLLLRRIAYNFLTLFRTVTQRAEERRGTPWKDLIRTVYNAVIAATAEQLAGLSARSSATPA